MVLSNEILDDAFINWSHWRSHDVRVVGCTEDSSRVCKIEGLIVSGIPLEDSQNPIICLIYLHRQLVGRYVGKAYPDQWYDAVAQPGH
jgi:uncharacterized protein YqfB (UPF0267 family)